MIKRSYVSQVTMFFGALFGSLLALFGLTNVASAAPVGVGSGFVPMLGDHVMELALMLAAPDQTSSAMALTNHYMMLAIVGTGFLAMVAGSIAFWSTLHRDFTTQSRSF